MTIVASAPGKAVLLGEYIVLDGAPALVMACERRCRAVIGPSFGIYSHLLPN
jgi:mevalonate kinase